LIAARTGDQRRADLSHRANSRSPNCTP
jgi:hypothetical protein